MDRPWLARACSSVSADKLIEKAHSITTTELSMRVPSTSMPVSGPKRISSSCGSAQRGGSARERRAGKPCTWHMRPGVGWRGADIATEIVCRRHD